MSSAFDTAGLGRALRTVRHLLPRQIAGQVRRRIVGPARNPVRPFGDGLRDIVFTRGFTPPSSEGRRDEGGRVHLLGRPGYDPLLGGWGETDDPLWSYTLHYHGWISAPECDPDRGRATILGWIDEHRSGVGWEPYPTSMRLLHWLGWLHARGTVLQASQRERIFASMAAQADHLSEHVETHIDGNHLWTNLAALVAVGLGMRGPLADRLVERHSPALLQVVQEQLAPDGVHRERTPTYHCLLAEQLHVIVTLASRQRTELRAELEPLLRAMVATTAAFTHPDGDVALWGDSQRDAPVTPAKLSTRTGLRLPRDHADAPDVGFHRRRYGALALLWNAGGVGLPHQTGHVHADALSVELSVDEERVLVDAGVGTYRPGEERSYARSTRAHNTATVGIGEPDQYEVWASHRIGARGEVQRLSNTGGRLAGAVRGYRSPGWHTRQLEEQGGALVITDTVQPAHVPASVRYHVPAEHDVRIDGERAIVHTAGGRRVVLELSRGTWARSEAPGWRSIGVPAPRTCLAARVSDGEILVRVRAG
jgi:hypothetical protein